MDILITEPLADVDHLAVVEMITPNITQPVVVDVSNRPMYVVDILSIDLCLQVVEVLQVVDVNTINL